MENFGYDIYTILMCFGYLSMTVWSFNKCKLILKYLSGILNVYYLFTYIILKFEKYYFDICYGLDNFWNFILYNFILA